MSLFCVKQFSSFLTVQRGLLKIVKFYCASFDIGQKFFTSYPPTETSTQKLKNQFLGWNSPGIDPNSVFTNDFESSTNSDIQNKNSRIAVAQKSSEFRLFFYSLLRNSQLSEAWRLRFYWFRNRKTMRVGKAATTMRKMHSKHSYVFGEENERLVTLRKKF